LPALFLDFVTGCVFAGVTAHFILSHGKQGLRIRRAAADFGRKARADALIMDDASHGVGAAYRQKRPACLLFGPIDGDVSI